MESEDLFADDSAVMEEEEEEEELTPLEVLERLEVAWTNEKFSPELLSPSSDVVECLLTRLSEMESSTSSSSSFSPLEKPLHELEQCRMRYLLSAYFRERLGKLTTYPKGNHDANLTPEEAAFLTKHRENLLGLFKRTVLQGMPGDFGEDASKIFQKEPPQHLDQTVFITVLQDVEGVLLRDETGGERDEHIDLRKGSQHILRYKDIKDLLKKGAVRLI